MEPLTHDSTNSFARFARRARAARPGQRLKAAIAGLCIVALLFAPGCVRLLAVEEGARSVVGDGTGRVKLDLTGIKAKNGERPDGVEIALVRLATGQVMYVLSESAGPTFLDHLPPGKYEVRCSDARLGTAKRLARKFKIVAGATMKVYLDDSGPRWQRGFVMTAEAIGTAIGYTVLAVLVVGLILLYLWAEAGAPGLDD